MGNWRKRQKASANLKKLENVRLNTDKRFQWKAFEGFDLKEESKFFQKEGKDTYDIEPQVVLLETCVVNKYFRIIH